LGVRKTWQACQEKRFQAEAHSLDFGPAAGSRPRTWEAADTTGVALDEAYGGPTPQ
jgi:hypothetical protein